MNRSFFAAFFLIQLGIAGYSTPNTGVKWNFDSLVVHSGGVVTGNFPTYIVNDTLFISVNDLLDVRKGSIIKISYRKGITIRGSFLALGSHDSLITFTVNDSTWQELRFEDSAVDSLCKLEYCIIEYARLGLNFVSASPTVQYSTIKNTGLISGSLAGSGNYGIQCFNSTAVIRYDSIYNNAQYGININSNASPTIEHCVIFNNNLQGTAFKNQISVGPQGINSPLIRHNEIYHDTVNIRAGAISISAFFTGSGSNAIIENNYLHNNAYGVAMLSQGSSSVAAEIRNNKIVNNTYFDPYAGGSGINCFTLSPSVNTTVIVGNLIQGNSWGVTIQGIASPNLGDLSNADTTDDGGNVFLNNKNRDTVFALYNNTNVLIKAQNNYWGSSNTDSVALVIFDSSDVGTLGRVLYAPFLTHSPISSVAQTEVAPRTFSLEQNYPNPFNPATTIKFRIRKSDFVSLTVSDLLGREVTRLIHNDLSEGEHSVVWNAEGISAGIYFYSLRIGQTSQTKKMVLLK
ncbi:MAG: right-handed parallel beta-helix repeat-containing protein [Ignavibacteriales bacterium]|nr:right-handed parallel beta-helix repeat-containing protein [Ignavibacteriales bacterium]